MLPWSFWSDEMGDFYKGWRPIVGCLTLLLACIFMSGWLRSISVIDRILWRFDNTEYRVMSHDGLFSFEWVRRGSPRPGRKKIPPNYQWTSSAAPTNSESVGHYRQVFHFAFFGIPLAFLSGWLLLHRRRPLKSSDPWSTPPDRSLPETGDGT
jgi:hypothetical protein